MLSSIFLRTPFSMFANNSNKNYGKYLFLSKNYIFAM